MNIEKHLAFFLIIAIAALIVLYPQPLLHPAKSKIAVIIIDGFRPDYLNYTANLASFAESNEYFVINTVEPSITPTVHASMVSCQLPANHGIVDYSTQFSGTPFLFKWGKENNLLVCSAYAKEYLNFFDNSYKFYYAPLVSDKFLIEKTKEYVEECDIIIASLPETDSIGHLYGPSSENTKELLKELDNNFADLIDYLRSKKVKIIVVSDHGMCDVNGKGIHNISEECALKIPLIIDKNLTIPNELDKNNLKLTNIVPIICNYYGFDCTSECDV